MVSDSDAAMGTSICAATEPRPTSSETATRTPTFGATARDDKSDAREQQDPRNELAAREDVTEGNDEGEAERVAHLGEGDDSPTSLEPEWKDFAMLPSTGWA